MFIKILQKYIEINCHSHLTPIDRTFFSCLVGCVKHFPLFSCSKKLTCKVFSLYVSEISTNMSEMIFYVIIRFSTDRMPTVGQLKLSDMQDFTEKIDW